MFAGDRATGQKLVGVKLSRQMSTRLAEVAFRPFGISGGVITRFTMGRAGKVRAFLVALAVFCVAAIVPAAANAWVSTTSIHACVNNNGGAVAACAGRQPDR